MLELMPPAGGRKSLLVRQMQSLTSGL